jgi:transposase-like protein
MTPLESVTDSEEVKTARRCPYCRATSLKLDLYTETEFIATQHFYCRSCGRHCADKTMVLD